MLAYIDYSFNKKRPSVMRIVYFRNKKTQYEKDAPVYDSNLHITYALFGVNGCYHKLPTKAKRTALYE